MAVLVGEFAESAEHERTNHTSFWFEQTLICRLAASSKAADAGRVKSGVDGRKEAEAAREGCMELV